MVDLGIFGAQMQISIHCMIQKSIEKVPVLMLTISQSKVCVIYESFLYADILCSAILYAQDVN